MAGDDKQVDFSMRALDSLLDTYDDIVSAPATAAETITRVEVAWLGRFRALRETLLRTTLDQIAWRLAERGHHAWVHELSGDDGDADTRDLIRLCVLPVGYEVGAHEPATLTYRPDEGRRLLVIESHVPASGVSSVVGEYPLEAFDVVTTVGEASEFIAAAFAAYPRIADPLPDPDDVA